MNIFFIEQFFIAYFIIIFDNIARILIVSALIFLQITSLQYIFESVNTIIIVFVYIFQVNLVHSYLIFYSLFLYFCFRDWVERSNFLKLVQKKNVERFSRHLSSSIQVVISNNRKSNKNRENERLILARSCALLYAVYYSLSRLNCCVARKLRLFILQYS